MPPPYDASLAPARSVVYGWFYVLETARDRRASAPRAMQERGYLYQKAGVDKPPDHCDFSCPAHRKRNVLASAEWQTTRLLNGSMQATRSDGGASIQPFTLQDTGATQEYGDAAG